MQGVSGSYFAIEMSEIGSEIFNKSDEFLSDIDEDNEPSFDEVEITQQVSTDNKKKSINSIKEQHSKLSSPIMNKVSEKSLSSCNYIASGSESNLFEGLLTENRQNRSVAKQGSSMSLPETNNSLKYKQLFTDRTLIDSSKIATKPHCKLQRRSTTLEVSQRPKELHNIHHNFLDDDECHIIWKPETPHKTTSSMLLKKKPSTWTMQSGTGPNLINPIASSASDQQHDIIASSAAGSMSPAGTPAELRQKQKQLMERVNLAREVAKDQNVKLAQPEVSQEIKRNALRQSSKYISFRMSKRYQHKDGVVFQPTGHETDTENKSTLTNSIKRLNQDSSPVINEAKDSTTSSLSSIHSEVLPAADIHTSDQTPLLGEVYTSQSDCTLSKSSSTTKKSVLKACTSYTSIKTKHQQLADNGASKTERQESIKKESFDSAKYPASADCNNVSKVAPVDCSDASGTTARFTMVPESVVATVSGITLNNNYSNIDSSEVTSDSPHINNDNTVVYLNQSGSLNNYNVTLKSTSHANPESNSSLLSSSLSPLAVPTSPLLPHDQVLMSSSTTLIMSEDNSCTNLIPHISSEATSLYTGQQEHDEKITPY